MLLRIGQEGIATILNTLAENRPHHIGMLSDSLAIAQKKIFDSLAEYKKNCQEISEELSDVDEFVSEKYDEAPVGKDQRELEVMSKLREAVSSLEELASTVREID